MVTVENGSVTSENRRFLNKLGHTQASPIPQTPQMKLFPNRDPSLPQLSFPYPLLTPFLNFKQTLNYLPTMFTASHLLPATCTFKEGRNCLFSHWYIPTWSICCIIKIYFSLVKENLIEVRRKGTMSICKYQILVIAGTPKAWRISATSKVSLEEPLPCSVNEYWQQTMNHQHDLHMK